MATSSTTRRPARRAPRQGTLTIAGIVVITLIPTSVMMLLHGLLFHGIGWFANLTFLVCCVFAATRVKRQEFVAMIMAPPLIYAAGIVIAGLTLGGRGGLVGTVANLGTYLAVGAPWLFVTTISCLVIVIVRGRTGR